MLTIHAFRHAPGRSQIKCIRCVWIANTPCTHVNCGMMWPRHFHFEVHIPLLAVRVFCPFLLCLCCPLCVLRGDYLMVYKGELRGKPHSSSQSAAIYVLPISARSSPLVTKRTPEMVEVGVRVLAMWVCFVGIERRFHGHWQLWGIHVYNKKTYQVRDSKCFGP